MHSARGALGFDQLGRRFGRGGGAAGGAPVGGEEFIDALVGVVGQAGDEVDQVGLGIGADQAAVFDQGEEIGQPRASVGVVDEQPVLGADLERADCRSTGLLSRRAGASLKQRRRCACWPSRYFTA